MSKLNIAAFIENTEAEGPGKRFAVWVQGCTRGCEGCCNPSMLDFISKTILDSSELCALIEKSKKANNIEGVTFLGGEPVLQAKGLSETAKFCHEKSLSVMLFSGYTYGELSLGKIPFARELLKHTDLFVDGPFDKAKPENERNWAGSTNQKFYFLTNFYKRGIEYDKKFSPGVEVRIHSGGILRVNGFLI